MTGSAGPADLAGSETLAIMSRAHNYNAWQFRRIAPYLGRRICEIGSGIGNMSIHLVGRPHELVALTDTDPFYLEHLRDRFGCLPGVRVEELSLPDPSAADRFRNDRFDTVVALNVLEHIPEDDLALASMVSLLSRGGRMVTLVPALPTLYGSLDRALGHLRRYTGSTLAAALERAGCKVDRVFYFNLVGALGWWLNARVRPAARISTTQLGWFDRLVPLLRYEDVVRIPFGLSVIGVGTVR